MAKDPHDEITELFARFAKAVEEGDSAAYETLCVDDMPPETELFERNSEKVRAAKQKLRVQRIDQEGEVAEVRFELVDASGGVVDEGMIVCTEEPRGWRIRAL